MIQAPLTVTFSWGGKWDAWQFLTPHPPPAKLLYTHYLKFLEIVLMIDSKD